MPVITLIITGNSVSFLTIGKRHSAPNGEPREGGGWFASDACSLDADYVACKNLARRVLFDFKLSRSKSLAYNVNHAPLTPGRMFYAIPSFREMLYSEGT